MYYHLIVSLGAAAREKQPDLFGLTAFWNVPQKLTFITWFSMLIPRMYLFFPDFFYKSYYNLKLFISYVFVKKIEN